MGGSGPGPRIYFPSRRHRWHHAILGLTIMGVGVAQGSPVLIAAGAAVVWHDWADKGSWVADLLYCREAAR